MTEAVSVDVTEVPVATTQTEQTAQPESDSAPQQGTQPDSAETDDKARDGGSVRKRIDKLTRDKWDERQARQAAEARAQELEQRLAQLQQQPKATPNDGPKESDYTDWMQYQQALVDHAAAKHVEKALAAQRQAETQRTQREQEQSFVRDFVVSAENLANELPDFNTAAGDIQMDGAIGQALLRNENGPAVAYYLGNHPAELMRVELIKDPLKAAIEIGRLEAKAQTFVQSRSRSKAPPQGQPLTQGGQAVSQGFTAKDSMEEFARKWRARK